jgi:hypothetical protein
MKKRVQWNQAPLLRHLDCPEPAERRRRQLEPHIRLAAPATCAPASGEVLCKFGNPAWHRESVHVRRQCEPRHGRRAGGVTVALKGGPRSGCGVRLTDSRPGPEGGGDPGSGGGCGDVWLGIMTLGVSLDLVAHQKP